MITWSSSPRFVLIKVRFNKQNQQHKFFTRVHFDPATEAMEAAGAAAVTVGGCGLEAATSLAEVTDSLVTVLLLLLLPLPEADVEFVVEAVEAAEEDLLEVDLPPVLLTFEAFAAFFSLSRDPDPPPDEAEPLPERWDDDLLSLAINGGLALLCSPPEKVNHQKRQFFEFSVKLNSFSI